ncbi:MAG: SBBP repeat-containing protein [Deltaproteobacteria bacterium]|nr:SBBP repeat-containing protein [Deltaproteobacteria bacterium]
MGQKSKVTLWLLALVFGLLTVTWAMDNGFIPVTAKELPKEQHVKALPAPDMKASVMVRTRQAYGKLPLHFEANQGQTDAEVKFLSRGRGYALFLTANEAVMVLRSETVLRMNLVGADSEPQVIGLDQLSGKVNYFIGNDPKKWRTNVPTYGKVRYQNVYPGIDLVYYGNQRQLEYDFIVAPGADPKAIRLAFEGANKIETDSQGDLVLSTSSGDVLLKKPHIYQLVNGVKQPIAGDYVFNPKSPVVGFQLAAYDTTKPLVIDPVLFYSSYLGGSGADSGHGIAVAADGSAYVTGTTISSNFPGAGMNPAGKIPATLVPGASTDVFVAKLVVDPNTFALSLGYSTYLGGSGEDSGNAIAVDSSGNAYVTGTTYSTDFPFTAGAYDKTCGTDGNCNGDKPDAFVAKLNSEGSALLYSTYLGGSNEDFGFGIAVDNQSNAYVTGSTFCPGGNSCGGGGIDNDFPVTSGAFSTVDPHMDSFMTKLSTDNSKSNGACTILNPKETYNDCADLLYSTYLIASGNGQGDDEGFAIAVDASGNAYVAGWTLASDLPTKNAFQGIQAGNRDAFVMKLKPDNSNSKVPCTPSNATVQYNDCADLLYSTYLGGGPGQESSGGNAIDLAIAVDSSGFIYVTGGTNAANFPGLGPGNIAPKLGSGAKGALGDVFVAKLDPSPANCTPVQNTNITCVESLIYSIYIGGTDVDTGFGIAVDNQGNAYVTGKTDSTDFPGAGSETAPKLGQGQFGEGGDVFVAKVNPSGTQILYSTLLGGTGGDTASGIALDASCNAYVTGQTFSPDFPLMNPLLQNFANKINVGENGDAFVAKIAQLGFRAYIGNFSAGSVSVIDTHTNTVGANPITVGTSPEGVAVHPDGTRVYVANLGNSSVSVINTATNTVMETVPLGVNLNPIGVAVHPLGKWVYVANSGVAPNKFTHTISVIDTATNALLDLDLNVPGIQQVELAIVGQANVPFGIAVSPDGTKVYVTNLVGNFVTVINVNTTTTPPTHSFVTTVPVGTSPQGVAVSPDGSKVYVANGGSGSVSVIKTTDDTKINFNTNSTDIELGATTSPFGVAAHPDGHTVYVTDGAGSSLFVLEFTMPLPALPTKTTVGVGNNPRGVAVTPDGALVYVANVSDDSVSVINTANDKRIVFTSPDANANGDLKVGTGPVALGQFIGFPVLDKDGDGIQDLVDRSLDGTQDQSNNSNNKTFSNKHLCGTVSGEILSGTAAIQSFAGLVAKAGPGGAQIKLCDFNTVLLSGGQVQPLSCGSLTAEVVVGPFQILLGTSGIATVPTGVTVRVAEIADGQFEVQNLGGEGTIIVEFNGQVTEVGPGGSGTFSPDSDGDGVPDHKDQCSGTPSGKVVDANGCSGEQLIAKACPCAGPTSGGSWKNHGTYVSCVTREAERVAKSGLINQKDKGAIVNQAARSTCGGK